MANGCRGDDLSRLGEFVESLHETQLSVGLFIPFPAAWKAVKEFMETDGELPTSIEWIATRDFPPGTFPFLSCDGTQVRPGEGRIRYRESPPSINLGRLPKQRFPFPRSSVRCATQAAHPSRPAQTRGRLGMTDAFSASRPRHRVRLLPAR
jgi:hypothetical protein